MRIIIINPREGTITEEDVPGQVDWRVIKDRIGDFIERAGSLPNGDHLWVDEMGLLKGPDHFFGYRQVNSQPLAGIGVITGPEEGWPEGQIVSARTPLDEVKASVVFLDRMRATRFDTTTTTLSDGTAVMATTPIIEPT